MATMTKVQLEWRAPSAPIKNGGRRSAFTEDIRDALRSRPKEWAVIDSRTYTTDQGKSRLKNNLVSRSSQWKKRYADFEFATRIEAEESRIVVFARYIG